MNGFVAASSLIALVAACSAATPANAEWVASQRERRTAESDPGVVGAVKETLVQTWLGADRMREETTGETGYLLRLDLKRAWRIDHAAKTCRESALAPLVDAPTLRGFGTTEPGAVVTETGETRTIGAWPCRRYHVSRKSMRGNAAPPAQVETDVWTTDAIPASAFLAERAAFGAGSSALLEELRKVHGFPVLQVERTTFLGKTEERVTELLAIEEKPAPPGTWDPPAGYSAGQP